MTNKMNRLFSTDRDGVPVSTFRLVTGLFLLCMCVRGFLAVNTVVISGDPTAFLFGVRGLGLGAGYGSLVEDKPLFQFLVYGLAQIIGDPTTAGSMIAVFFSSLTVVFLYPLFREYVPESIAILAVLLYILHPTINDEHTKAITDGTFTCFFFGGMYLFHRYVYADKDGGVKEWAYLVGSLLLSALAIATRPESALLFLIHSITLVVLLVRGTKPLTAAAGLGLYVVLPLAAGFSLLGQTFLDLLMNPATHSGDVRNLFDVLTGKEAIDPVRKWPWYSEAIDEFLELGYYHLNLFLVIGLFVTNWTKPFRHRILYLSYFVLYYLFVMLAVLGNSNAEYINERYLMIGFIVLLPVIASGIAWTYDKIRSDWNRPKTALLVLAVVLVALLPRTLEKGVIPRNTDELGRKKAGLWIKEHSGERMPVVLSSAKKIPYFAGLDRTHMKLIRHLRHDTLDQLIDSTDATYLAFSEKYVDNYPILEQAFDHSDLGLLYTYGASNEQIYTTYVFRIDRS